MPSEPIARKPVIIEAALNGERDRSLNPNVPLTPAEIADDALACLEAGATIIHVHNGDLSLAGEAAAERYAEIARRFLAVCPDALWYPTLAGRSDSPATSNSHLPFLLKRVPVQFGVLDPGATNMGWWDGNGVPAGFAIGIGYDAIVALAAQLQELGLGASMGIYEPGYLHAALALHHAGRLPRGSIAKLYFGVRAFGHYGDEGTVAFGLPMSLPALGAYVDMIADSGVEWFVSAVGGDIVRSAVAARALELGGHLHVGLEFHHDPGRTPTNAELVEEAVALVRNSGRPLATTADTIALLDVPVPKRRHVEALPRDPLEDLAG